MNRETANIDSCFRVLIRENFPFYNGQDFGMVEEDTVVQLAGNGITMWNTSKRMCENIE